MSAEPCTRPALRWFGGKWRLAPWIVGHFPPHRIYIEPFAGAASVLLRKERSYAEVLNDLDGEVVNFFRVLRDSDAAPRLIEQLRLTPFARVEFEEAYGERSPDPDERARRLVALSYMGFGANAVSNGVSTGFRANSNRSHTTPAHDWKNYPDCLVRIVERLRGVVIENQDARKVMGVHDAPDALHYVDPPYPLTTRGHPEKNGYRHEMEDVDHRELVIFLRELKGAVVVSGYAHPIYTEGLRGWRRLEKASMADGARSRVEVLWLNPAAIDHGPLFHNRGHG